MENASNKSDSTWRMQVSGVFLVLMFAVVMPVWGKGIVAYIDAVNGQKWDFSINGYKKGIYSGRPLKEGDVIRVDKQGSSITLNLNGTIKPITHGSYTVKLIPRAGLGGFFNQFTNWVSGLFLNDYRRKIAGTKGGNSQCESSKPFSIPILNNGNAKLLEGKRQLHIGWSGGPSRYRVQVYQVLNGTDKEVKELYEPNIQIGSGNCQKLEIPEVRLKTWTFEKGKRYKIKITNEAGKKKIGTFTVVSDSQDPRQGAKVVIPVSAESSDTKEVEVTLLPSFLLQAGWLAQHGNGEWMLEAYQTVVASQKNHSAQLVKLALSLGQVAPIN